jgi:hypothetical protein
MTTSEIVFGIVVFYGIGYATTHNVGNILEIRKREKNSSIPPQGPVDLDINTNSIIGGIVAVALVFILVFMAQKEKQALFFYKIIGVGVVLVIFTYGWFKFKSYVTPVTETPPDQIPGQDEQLLHPNAVAKSTYDQLPEQDEKLLHANSHDNGEQLLIRSRLYEDLLVKCRRDKGVADRLIEYERKRKPNAGELELIENAIERWEKDNRSWRG